MKSMKYNLNMFNGWYLQIALMSRGTHQEGSLLLAVLNKEKLVNILKHMLDEKKFLSPFGIRSLSKVICWSFITKTRTVFQTQIDF